MEGIKHFGLIAVLLPLAFAGPVEVENNLFKRGNDICNRTAAVGESCNHGPEESQPHICGRNDPRAVLHCVSGKWALNNQCGAGKHCTCNGNGATGDIVCKS